MAKSGSIDVNTFDHEYAYAISFGNLKHKTVYADPGEFRGPAGEKQREGLLKSFKAGVARLKAQTVTSGGAGTAGYAMVPIHVDPRVVDRTRKNTPMVEVFPRVSNRGMYADYNVITAKGGGFSAGEDAALTETNTTYDRASTAIKFFYAVGRVTGPSQAAQPGYIMQGMVPAGGDPFGMFSDRSAPNALQMEVLVKTQELRELEEDTIINGNATADATEYDGIIVLMGSTNTVDKNTSALSLDDIPVALQYAFDDGGRPNLAVCSSGVYTDLLKLISAKFGYMKAEETVFWGFNTLVLKGYGRNIPVIPSMYMSNTSGSKAIYFLDMDVWEMRVLQDITYEPLAKTNDSNKFMLKVYEALICKAAAFNSSITEISG
jgi:hypothetical protein